jgi:predicted nucleotide-binding protein (sugar kinase/HSP70/actin superfamily)
MRIGIPQELMTFPWMVHLVTQLSAHADITWQHRPAATSDTIMLSEGDACQPFKSMVRTSVALLPEVDLLLLPRLVKLDGHLMCPNFRALPDIIRLNINRTCAELEGRLHDITIDLDSDTDSSPIIITLLKQLFGRTIAAHQIQAEPQPPSILDAGKTRFREKTIALLGHPYLLEQEQLNMGIRRQLQNFGYHVTTPRDIPFSDLNELAKSGDYYAKNNYWRSSRETLGAFHYYTTIKRPAGIIYLVPFNCGVDALMRIELMSLQRNLDEHLPFMVIVGDEHTQQEHTATRLEAYLDIIDGI